jgi:hypothetical protein
MNVIQIGAGGLGEPIKWKHWQLPGMQQFVGMLYKV